MTSVDRAITLVVKVVFGLPIYLCVSAMILAPFIGIGVFLLMLVGVHVQVLMEDPLGYLGGWAYILGTLAALAWLVALGVFFARGGGSNVEELAE